MDTNLLLSFKYKILTTSLSKCIKNLAVDMTFLNLDLTLMS
jgi:hypothetical protein